MVLYYNRKNNKDSYSSDFLNLLQYMIVLFIVFVVQISLSCACLALTKDQQVYLHLHNYKMIFPPIPNSETYT